MAFRSGAGTGSAMLRVGRTIWLRRIAWLVVAVVLGSGVVGGVVRGLADQPDWRSWQGECRYVWEHGHTSPATKMFGYLPATVFALMPFAVWLPQPAGLGLFVGVNLLAALGSLYVVYRWWLAGANRESFVWAAVLICANFQHVLQANQLTLWALLLCVSGLALIEHGRGFAGGLVLGLGAVMKVMPFLLGGYLLLRRRGWALVGMVVAAVVFDLLPSVAFFGWRGAWTEHMQWFARARTLCNRRQIEDPLRTGVHRFSSNFSYSAVLSRWLRGVPDAREQIVLFGQPPQEVVQRYRAALRGDQWLTLDPLPRHELPAGKGWEQRRFKLDDVPRFSLARWTAPVVWGIWLVTVAAAVAALAWMTLRTAGPDALQQWAPAASLWMLAAFFITPLMRHYYLSLAFPAIAVVLHASVDQSDRWRTNGRLMAAICATAWLIGVACLGWDVVRWYGLHLLVVGVLAGGVAWAWRRVRQPVDRQAQDARVA